MVQSCGKNGNASKVTLGLFLFCKIEEQILECLAWSHDSPLWTSIHQAGSVPSCEEVSLQNHTEGIHSTQSLLASPIIHPRVQRICGEEGAARRGEAISLFATSFHQRRQAALLSGWGTFFATWSSQLK